MREVVADKNIPNVGGFVSVISNRRPGFCHSVYTDMLFNWPDGQHSDYAFNPKEQIDFGASGENYEYSTSQISTGYLGLNIVGFYLLRARKVFLFFGHNNNLAAKCRVIDAVEPNDIAKRLSDSLGFDFLWLLAVGALLRIALVPASAFHAEVWVPLGWVPDFYPCKYISANSKSSS